MLVKETEEDVRNVNETPKIVKVEIEKLLNNKTFFISLQIEEALIQKLEEDRTRSEYWAC